jgi:hypothetical protein
MAKQNTRKETAFCRDGSSEGALGGAPPGSSGRLVVLAGSKRVVDALSAIDIQSRRSGNEVIRRRLVVHDLVRPFEIDMIRQVVIVALLCAASSYALAEQGRASHYGHGDGFHGRKTTSGERFNALAMTAAHRTRPDGKPCDSN